MAAPPDKHADEALESGDVNAVARTTATRNDEGIRERFARVRAQRPPANEAGRRFVAAYVDYGHFVEATRAVNHHEEKSRQT